MTTKLNYMIFGLKLIENNNNNNNNNSDSEYIDI